MSVLQEVGLGYERTLILSTFRSSAADICARFFAKDMHSGKRGEIEHAIKHCIENEFVVVQKKTLDSGLETLVCIIAGKFDPAKINKQIQQSLPSYMIPSKYIAIDQMPLNNSGKIDRTKLKEY